MLSTLIVDCIVGGVLGLSGTVGVGAVSAVGVRVAVLSISGRNLGVAAPETALLAGDNGRVGRVLLASAAEHAVLDMGVGLLLRAVVLDNSKLVGDGEEEQDCADNGQDPGCLQKSASVVGRRGGCAVGVTEAVGTEAEAILVHDVVAVLVAAAGLDGDGNEGADEAHIEDHSDEAESGDAAKEASEEDAEERVERCSA